MNNDQLAILRLVADAANEYVDAMEISSSPNSAREKTTAPGRLESVAHHAAQSYEKLKTAIDRYREAFDIK